MARSKEALMRRAAKRGRTVEDQKLMENETVKKKKTRPVDSTAKTEDAETDERLLEPGAWKCPRCGNNNFASRDSCHTKTCRESRPQGISRPSKGARHDPVTSKSSLWVKQADEQKLNENMELRRKYTELGGTGLSEEEIERAKILIARDDRNKLKKKTKNSKSASKASNANGDVEDFASTLCTTERTKDLKTAQKALRKRFLKTGGKGMSTEECERAKILVARDERKKEKRLKYSVDRAPKKKEPLPASVT